jgi:uncharacterized membrane protein HdeD (DUF308 family)
MPRSAVMASAEAGHIEFRPAHTEPAAKYWYLLAISGAISCVVGLLVIAYPSPSLKLLGVILGIELLLAGILAMVRGFTGNAAAAYLVLGVLAIGGGVVVIRNPGESLVLLVLVFAIYMIIAGALALVRALAEPEGRAITAVRGVVLVTVGTVIVAWPDIGLKTLAVFAGIGLVLQGVVEIAEALAVRSLDHSTRV